MSVANFSLHCSLMDGWVLLWVISRGVSWIVGILFLECAVRAILPRVLWIIPHSCGLGAQWF